jgi:hypothetical protein
MQPIPDSSFTPSFKLLHKKDYVDYSKFQNFADSENQLAMVNVLKSPEILPVNESNGQPNSTAERRKISNRKKVSSYDM